MGRTTLDEVHPHRPRRIRPQLLQLQAHVTHLQGKFAVRYLHWQAQALGPLLGLWLESRVEGLNMDAAGRRLINHRKTRSKN
ncbi:hypothetical protein D9M71_539580 [compost metagenome]